MPKLRLCRCRSFRSAENSTGSEKVMEQEDESMSECVIRMDEPNSCWGCPCADCERGVLFCTVDDDRRRCTMDFRPEWCPIIAVLPEHHGRLVDADALIEQHKPSIFTTVTDFTEGQRSVVANIKNAPTIVPATERIK